MSHRIPPSANELLRDLAGAIETLDRFEQTAIDAARTGLSDADVDRHVALINAHTEGIVAMARMLIQATGHAAERIKRNDLFTRLN